MRKILQNKVAIIAVMLVMLFSVFSVVKAQSEDSNLLDRIVMAYLQLKLGGMGEIGDQMMGAGSMAVENYIPIIRHNDGYYSEKDITTTSNLTVLGTSSFTGLTTLNRLAVTSTTATSTFSTGGIIVATDRFIIEQSSGKIGIGTLTPTNFISEHLSNTASLDFGVIAANSCSDLTITVTGAVDGNTVVLGVPNALANASSTLTFFGWVSAADTVSVRVCQVAALATSDPAAATIRADVWKH